MNEVSAIQPSFFEGQYLGADDLATLVTYFKTSSSRRGLMQSSWGIAAGLQLTTQEIGPNEFQVSLMPGIALDGYGRLIVVTHPTEIPTEKFVGLETGVVRIWVRYDQSAIRSARPGYNTCSAEDAFRRIEESFEIEVGERPSVLDRQSGISVAGAAVDDAREAANTTNSEAPLHCDGSVPYQEFPVDDENDIWLIPVGIVSWASATNSFRELTEDQKYQDRMFRRDFGTITEDILAANGLLRLRDRATVFDADIGAACAEAASKATDYVVCDGQLTARELIWLEGDTRITGDFRMFGKRFEFRDEEGRDYVARNAGGASTEPIQPMFFERVPNDKNGEDLRLAIGPDGDGPNRFAVGPSTVGGATLCDLTLESAPHFVVQADGKVGVGTAQAPDSDLEAALTIRGVEGTTEVMDPIEGIPTDVPIWHLVHLESAGGETRWEFDLWTDEAGLSVHRPGGNPGTLYLSGSDDVGLSTTAPEAKLDIADTETGSNPPLGTSMWIRAGDGDDAGRFWVEYGSQNAPLLVMSDADDPPRMQFQQTGANADETNPSHATWIGHISSLSEDFGIVGDGLIGLGTATPYADVTVDGTLGFKLGNAPLVHMFESGTTNPRRMVLSHSPNHTEWGLAYEDSDDRFDFQRSDANDPALSIDLSSDEVGVRTRSPRSALEVQGSVRLGDDGNLFAPGMSSDMRIVSGEVLATGARLRGDGFSSVRTSTGHYTVTFSDVFTSAPIVVVSSSEDPDNVVSVNNVGSNQFLVRSFDASNIGDAEGDDDSGFTFIAIGAR